MYEDCDFSGWATKNDVVCDDGLVINKDAFKAQDGQRVTLVWQHISKDPNNVLGHAYLENRDEGVYVYGFLNPETPQGQNAKLLVKHKDVDSLSIFANGLMKKGRNVLHGAIREVSLCISGMNREAKIDYLSFEHDGMFEDSEDEAIIYTGLTFEHSAVALEKEPVAEETEEDNETVGQIFDAMTDKQKRAVYSLIEDVMADDSDDSDDDDSDDSSDDEAAHSSTKGDILMKKNLFDKEGEGDQQKTTLTHAQIQEIINDVSSHGGSFGKSFIAHAVTYGIENIDYLFPDAKTIQDSPDFVSRRMEWVTSVLNGARHSPFSRIKSMSADITLDTARAKGYVKASLKKEEFFAIAKRTTTPTTFYKKQKLDRDDIIDIVDLDVVAWMKAEMRLMLDEELARAILLGDGREVDDPDKIPEDHIRPIVKDDVFYTHKVQVAAGTTGNALVEAILRARTYYKGTGSPTLFTTNAIMTDMLLAKDKIGRRYYNTKADLASALNVSSIVEVEVMENYAVSGETLLGVVVNMSDYTIGADRGGQIAMFDDFDIDYNQNKYLMEGRCSGCLTKPKSALAFWQSSGTKATPTAPTINTSTNVITIPSITGVEYYIDDVKCNAGAQSAITENTWVMAKPATGYYFEPNITVDWEMIYTA